MPKDDDAPTPALVGRAGLVFAYVCFAIAIATLVAALYLLPLDLKAKVFLTTAMALLVSMFVFMAIIAHLAYGKQIAHAGKSRRKASPPPARGDADGSQKPR